MNKYTVKIELKGGYSGLETTNLTIESKYEIEHNPNRLNIDIIEFIRKTYPYAKEYEITSIEYIEPH